MQYTFWTFKLFKSSHTLRDKALNDWILNNWTLWYAPFKLEREIHTLWGLNQWSFFTGTFVRSPQKLFILIIPKKKYRMKVSEKIFNIIWKKLHWSVPFGSCERQCFSCRCWYSNIRNEWRMFSFSFGWLSFSLALVLLSRFSLCCYTQLARACGNAVLAGMTVPTFDVPVGVYWPLFKCETFGCYCLLSFSFSMFLHTYSMYLCVCIF